LRIAGACQKDWGGTLDFLESGSFHGKDLHLDGRQKCSIEERPTQLDQL
jgi:hypothetical protein